MEDSRSDEQRAFDWVFEGGSSRSITSLEEVKEKKKGYTSLDVNLEPATVKWLKKPR